MLALYLALTCTDKINYDVLKWMYSPVDVVKCMQLVDKIGHNDSGFQGGIKCGIRGSGILDSEGSHR